MTIILDPTDEREPVERGITPRTGPIKGVLALLDISKPRGSVLLDELETLFKARLPEITIKRYRKPTFAKPAPAPLRQVIKMECNYLVEALAD
jgi:hypothetical protein